MIFDRKSVRKIDGNLSEKQAKNLPTPSSPQSHLDHLLHITNITNHRLNRVAAQVSRNPRPYLNGILGPSVGEEVQPEALDVASRLEALSPPPAARL